MNKAKNPALALVENSRFYQMNENIRRKLNIYFLYSDDQAFNTNLDLVLLSYRHTQTYLESHPVQGRLVK